MKVGPKEVQCKLVPRRFNVDTVTVLFFVKKKTVVRMNITVIAYVRYTLIYTTQPFHDSFNTLFVIEVIYCLQYMPHCQ